VGEDAEALEDVEPEFIETTGMPPDGLLDRGRQGVRVRDRDDEARRFLATGRCR